MRIMGNAYPNDAPAMPRMSLGRPLPQAALDDVSRILGRQLAIYTKACQSTIAEKVGLPLLDFKALEFIIEFEALPTGQIAHLMGLSPGGTTALINRLEAAGFVRRSRHLFDRRVIAIRPVKERCQHIPLLTEQVITDIVNTAARNNPMQVQAMHGFLLHCVHTLKNATLQWLETESAQSQSEEH